MRGCDLQEIYDFLMIGNQIVFIYDNKMYFMDHEDHMFIVDRYEGNYKNLFDGSHKKVKMKVICRYKYKEQNMEAVEGFLNEKCYDGKSFYEIEKDVEIDRVY